MSVASKITTSSDKNKALSELNAKHAVVSEGGRTLVLNEELDPSTRWIRVTRSSVADIRSLYQNRKVKRGNDKWTTLGDWWLQHPKRRQYKGVVFVPQDKEIPGYFNLWRSFSVEPVDGNWSLYLQHMFEIICSGDAELFNYLLAWMAAGVQRPDVKPEVAIVLSSPERGTGKSMFTKYYRQLFGQHGIEISNPAHLAGRFNGHLEDCCVLVLNEAMWAGSRAAESVLKSLITEDTIALERKGMDVKTIPSYLRIMMTSNDEWVVPAGLDERRFLVLDVDPKRKQDTAYFAKIVEEMENGGLAAMLYFLREFDYSDIDLRRPPQTAALIEQKLQSLDSRQRWLFDKFHEGRLLPDDNVWYLEISKAELHKDYCEELRKTGDSRTSTQAEFGKFLRTMLGSKLTESRPKRNCQRVRCWQFPSLQDCRKLFDHKLGASYDWPPADLVAVEQPGNSASGKRQDSRASRA